MKLGTMLFTANRFDRINVVIAYKPAYKSAYKHGYKRFIKPSLILMVFTLLFFANGPTNLYAMDLLVNTSTTDNKISRNKARLYFSQRQTRWPDGTTITLVVLPDNDPCTSPLVKKSLGFILINCAGPGIGRYSQEQGRRRLQRLMSRKPGK